MSDWVLITGASVGIGRELAEIFAANHFNVAVTARNQKQLEQLAADLRTRHGVETNVIVQDLTNDSAPAEIFAALRDIPISILVNNAGFGFSGSFLKGGLEMQLGMMQVNMTALIRLTHLFAPGMVARGSGRILNVASVAAFLPGPYIAIYYATKAFVHSFSVALGEELAGTGVTVTALCPGSTRTEFFDRAGMSPTLRNVPMMDARTVAEAGYRGLMRGKRVVVPGAMNKAICGLLKFAPEGVVATAVAGINRPKN